MTSADTPADSLDPTLTEPRGWTLRRLLAPFAVGLALLSAFLTFVVLTGLTPITPTSEVVVTFLLINAATILLLVGIIGREVWQVVQARRRGRAAARLHVQIVSLFSIIAVIPAVLVSVVANVSRPDQQIIGATLANLPQAVAQASGPAVLLLGLAPRAAALSLPHFQEAQA